MVPRSRFARTALVIFCLLLLPSVACAAAVQPVSGLYPERLPADSTPLYVWNESLSVLILGLVCVSAQVLIIPVQILLSLLVWLRFGHKRVTYRNVFENETRNAVYMCIRENPGSRMRSLSRTLGVNIGTSRYHVGVLCRIGMVVAEQDSGGRDTTSMRVPIPTGIRKYPGTLMNI